MKSNLDDIFNIKEKTVLITGAAGYFGRYMARTFLDVGAKVVLLSKSKELKKQSAFYIKEYGKENVSFQIIDFYEHKKLKNILKKILLEHKIDTLINNAYDISSKTGFNSEEGKLENIEYSTLENSFKSGIYWALLTTQVIGEQFKLNGKGSIINISSMYGIVSPSKKLYENEKYFNPPTYSVVKSGIIGLTRYTASFWGEYGIRCNAIAPGPFSNVESQTGNSVNINDPFIEKLKQKTVLNRIGHPKDLSGALIYLASDASSYMTGQVLTIDGGWTIT